jgi:protein involved in polysaccharide export with SLBB domain
MTQTLIPQAMRFVRTLPAFLGIGAVAAVLLANPASAQTGARETAPPPDPAATTLMPGDGLQIGIWREPDLSGEFVVDEHGNVTLPLLGTVPVAGIPIDTVRARLIEAYQVDLRNPSITILPLRRIFVLGDVNRPGLQALDPTLSLAGAVAIAGGASPLGDLRRLTIVRDGRELGTDFGPEMDLLSVGVISGDQIFVGRRSWWERNAPFVTSTVLGVAGIVVAILR